jgi:O-antigen/teichoic acid export membrane protein
MTGSRRPSFVRNILANYGGQASVVITGIVLTPILLGSLGPSMYGVLVLVMSIQGLASLLDLGVSASVVKYVAEHEAREEPAARNAVLSTLSMLHLVVGLVAGALLTLVALVGLPLFDLAQGDMEATRGALLVAAVGIAVNMVLSVPGNLIVGLRRFDVSNAVTVTQTLVSAVVTVAALSAGAGPAGLVAINVIGVALGYLIRWWYGRRLLPDLRISPRLADRATLRRVGAYGGWLFLVDAGKTLFYHADAVLIALFLPVAAVGSYSLGFRPASAISYIAGPLVAVFIPTAATMHARNEAGALQRLLLDGTRLSFGLTLAGAVWLWTFGDLLIEAWIGPGHDDAVAVMSVFVAVFLMGAFQYSASAVLRGVGAVRGFATVVLGEYAANIALSLVLIPRIGILGAAIGSLVPAVIADGLLIPRLACRAVGVAYLDLLRAVPGAIVAGAVTAGALIALRQVLVSPDLVTAIVSALVAATVFLAAFAIVGLTATERRAARERLGAAMR